MKVLVDTSVWSAALRRVKKADGGVVDALRALVREHRVEIIGPVRQEVLSGLREQAQFERLEEHLAAFPDIPLESEDFVRAAEFFSVCRSKGIQGSNTDFLICAVAVRYGLAIFTTDKDFSRFAEHLPVSLYEFEGVERA